MYESMISLGVKSARIQDLEDFILDSKRLDTVSNAFDVQQWIYGFWYKMGKHNRGCNACFPHEL